MRDRILNKNKWNILNHHQLIVHFNRYEDITQIEIALVITILFCNICWYSNKYELGYFDGTSFNIKLRVLTNSIPKPNQLFSLYTCNFRSFNFEELFDVHAHMHLVACSGCYVKLVFTIVCMVLYDTCWSAMHIQSRFWSVRIGAYHILINWQLLRPFL